jgi:AcrR family transcriptional regulator
MRRGADTPPMTENGHTPARLPRGRHKLSRSTVMANQRERLLAAATEALAEHGYSALTVDQVIEGAGVSRATFYQQFADKHECVLAAHEEAFERLRETIAAACVGQDSWAGGVAAGVAAAVDFAVESPNQASLVTETYPAASDPVLARHGLTTHEFLAGLLRTGPEGNAAPPPSELTERAVIGATVSVIGGRLMSGEADRLEELKPDLIELVLTPYLGGEKARTFAHNGALPAAVAAG